MRCNYRQASLDIKGYSEALKHNPKTTPDEFIIIKQCEREAKTVYYPSTKRSLNLFGKMIEVCERCKCFAESVDKVERDFDGSV